MRITRLQLENFRSYNSYEYMFDENSNFTILIGPNGKGKTNFLESIYLISFGKSFRTSSHEDLISWENEFSRCKADIKVDEEKESLEVFCSILPKKTKNFKHNEIKLTHNQYFGKLLTVLFQPEDLNMLYLSPSLRRKYLNLILAQTDKRYLQNLSSYSKTLKQRNSLLYRIRENKFKGLDITTLLQDLDAWDTHFTTYAVPIIQKRLELISYLKERIQKIYQSISGKTERISIDYQSKVSTNDEDIEQKFKNQMENRRMREIFSAKTSFGPHLDDLIFYIDGREISKSASRGEFRTLLLSIKLAEIDYIKDITGQTPVLLLDDVFSELDEHRKSHFLKSIKDCQTIITSTDIIGLEDIEQMNVVNV